MPDDPDRQPGPNRTAISSGFGSGVLTIWIWNSMIVPSWEHGGLVLSKMDAEVAAVVAGSLMVVLGEVFRRRS